MIEKKRNEFCFKIENSLRLQIGNWKSASKYSNEFVLISNDNWFAGEQRLCELILIYNFS